MDQSLLIWRSNSFKFWSISVLLTSQCHLHQRVLKPIFLVSLLSALVRAQVIEVHQNKSIILRATFIQGRNRQSHNVKNDFHDNTRQFEQFDSIKILAERFFAKRST